jgi:hypothetical protein
LVDDDGLVSVKNIDDGYEITAVLIFDNHSSRSRIDSDYYKDRHQLEFLFLPPATPHIPQRIDFSVKNDFKQLLVGQFCSIPVGCASDKKIWLLQAPDRV